jgi:hypothetical protein
MRSRLFLLSSIIMMCLVAAPAVASAQHVFRSDRVHRGFDRYRYDSPRYDFGARAERLRLQAAERAERSELRAERRAESRARAMRARMDRDFMRHDLSMRIRDRIEASRARSRYRW